MMMMSSNTVGNHDFNTAGITPFDAKKPQAKKEATLKLANAKADSFERTPRDTTPEAPPTVETPAKEGGNSVIAIGLSMVSLLGAGIASWFAISKGEEVKVAQTAADAAKTLAETAKKEVKTLEATVTSLAGKVGGISETEVADLIQTALENHPNQGAITTQIMDAVESKLDATAVKDLIKQALTGNVDEAKVTELLTKALEGKMDKSELAELIKRLTTLEQKFSARHPEVAGKPVSLEVQSLFKRSKKEQTAQFKDLVNAYQDKRTKGSSLPLIQEGLNFLDDTPGAISALYYDLPAHHHDANIDPYFQQLIDLKGALGTIHQIFQRDKVDHVDSLGSKEIFKKYKHLAQAVVKAGDITKGGTEAKVKIAQKTLVEELKNQFGKSRTDQFKAQYGDSVVKDFTTPTDLDEKHGWVLKYFEFDNEKSNPNAKSLDEMAYVITEAGQGLDGKQTNNTHRDPQSFATIVLHSLIDGLYEANPETLHIGSNTNIKIKEGKADQVAEPVKNLVNTLEAFRQALQSINPEQEYGGDLFRIKTDDEIKALGTVEKQLQARMINARLEGKTDEIADTTEKMYNKLREDLQALQGAKLTPAAADFTGLNIPKLPPGKSVMEALSQAMGHEIPDEPARVAKEVELEEQIGNTLKSAIEKEEEQIIVKDALLVLFKAAHGEILAEKPELKRLSNSKEVIQAFQEVIGTVLDNPSNENITFISDRMIQVIKEGLPPAEVAKAVDVVAETLVQGIPLQVKDPVTQYDVSISTFEDLLNTKQGGAVVASHAKLLTNATNTLNSVDKYRKLNLSSTKKDEILKYFKTICALKNDSVLDTCLEGLTTKEPIINLFNETLVRYKQIEQTAVISQPVSMHDTINQFIDLIIAGLPKEASS